MVVRLTFCKFLPDKIAEAKRIYNQDIVPVAKKQKGNLRIFLLEPVNTADDFISVTEWKSKEEADAYQSSGVYKSLVSKLEKFFMKEPAIKVYNEVEAFTPSYPIL
ncbi:MAG TPA: antibiotic biosynthesis monooxygenase [Flavisolibacter sp.]|nr:antibiotic biosynthesis monooxygenase [Flavisolibacter sp.]